jgi:hypothetical protein
MGWQEELRRLDVELANGRITHENHRKQRDELLAAASAGGDPSPVASPLRRPAGPANQQWQSANPDLQGRPTAPVTPLPPPTPAPLFTTDRRTTAPSPADQRNTDHLPLNAGRMDSPTVVLPAVLPPPQPPPRTYRPAGAPVSAPVRHGRKRTWLFIALGVLLVLALIIGGTWWLGVGQRTSEQPAQSQSQADALADRLPALPGTANPKNATMSIAKGLELGLYPARTADTLTRNGSTEVIFRGSAEGSRGYLVMVIPTGSPTAAQAVVEQLYQSALTSGFTQVQSDLRAATGIDGKTRLNATWYASGSTVVSVGLSQPANVDQATLTAHQAQTVRSMRDVLPAG